MRRMKKYKSYKRVTALLLAVMLGMPTAAFSTAWFEVSGITCVQAEEEPDQTGEEVSLTEEETGGKTAAASKTYEGEENAMTAEEYKEFGLQLDSPSEFDSSDTSNPLEDYEEHTLSELYLGEMNRDKTRIGAFRVMENISDATASTLNINNMSNHLVGSKTSFPYSGDDDQDTQTENACGIDYDGDGIDELIDTTLYVYDSKSYMDVVVYDQDGDSWKHKTDTMFILSDGSSDEKDFVSDIEADSSKAFTSIVAGDFDGDGKEEAAVYVPGSGSMSPLIAIMGADDGGELITTQKIALKDIAADSFNMSYEEWYLPSVNLAVTQISGQDDLVISASLPLDCGDDYDKKNQDSITEIFRYQSGSTQLESCGLNARMNYGNYRMRFASAIDTDLNGNGIGELLIGGFKNYGFSSKDKDGELSESENLITLVCWNEKTNAYEMVWNTPKTVGALTDAGLRVDKKVMEPAALAAGAFTQTSKVTQVFLEGVVFRYSGGGQTSATEKENFQTGTFVQSYKMKLSGDNDAFISTACAANFSSGNLGQDQMVIISGDHYSMNKDDIYYDISWIWEENGSLTGAVTNNDYFSKQNEDDNGTFLSLCPVDVDSDTIQVKYTGKSYGWSAPVLYTILESAPYWQELSYNSETFGAGSTSFTSSVETATGVEGEWGVGLSYSINASAIIGAGFLGTGGGVGFEGEMEAMAQYVGSYMTENATESKVEIKVAPGEDSAVLLAIPVVAYSYDVLIPEHIATQEEVDNYQTIEEANTEVESCPYKVGDTVPAQHETISVSQQLEQSYTSMSLEDYNELAEKYEDRGLTTIKSTDLSSKKIGDPASYPHDESDIGGVNVQSIGSPVAITEGEKEFGMSFSKETTKELSNGFELEFSDSILGAMKAEVSLGLEAEVEVSAGFGIALNGGCSWLTANTKGMEFSGAVAGFPAGTEDSYTFTAQLALYNVGNAGSADTSGSDDLSDGPYAVGYIVTGQDEQTAPPALGENLRVYTTTEHEVVLRWDTPETRAAGSYKLYMTDNLGELQEIGRVSGDQKYFIATGLNPDTTYHFTMQSYSDENCSENPSCIGRGVDARTKALEGGAPYFTLQPENGVAALGDADDEGVLGSYTFTSHAVSDETESEQVSYQWQKFTESSLTGVGTFENIEGETASNLTVRITEEDKESYENPVYYRVVASRLSDHKSIYSRVVTLFINGEDGYEYKEVMVSLGLSGNLYQVGTGYYMYEDTEVTLSAAFQSKIEGDRIPEGQGVTFYGKKESDGTTSALGDAVIDKNGTASLALQNLAKDTYDIYAIYSGGPSDKVKTDYFLPAMSESCRLNVGQADAEEEYYKLSYHTNGGSNDISNPHILTAESVPVTLLPATRVGAVFTEWYTDAALTSPLQDGTIYPDQLAEQLGEGNWILDLYAGWSLEEYAIHYELDGGENAAENPDRYNVESGSINLVEPTKEGYQFKGWYTDEARTIEGDTISNGSTGERTFYALWEEIPVPDPFDEDGETYLIGSLEELISAAQMVHDYYGTYGNATFRLTANINGEGSSWKLPIGTEELPFQGTFQGDNYIIYNLNLQGEESCQGIFGVIGESGIVENLKTTAIKSDGGAQTAGGIAGMNAGTIEKCNSGLYLPQAYWITDKIAYLEELNSNITASEMAGGIAGINRGQIEDSSSAASVSSGSRGGGIAGVNAGSISNGYNMGTVTVQSGYSGGITGENRDGASLFNLYNIGLVSGGTSATIAGYSDDQNITVCYYSNSSQAACGNQELEGAEHQSSSQMRTAEFAQILNENIQGQEQYNTWSQTKYRNGDYPKVMDNNLAARTLTADKEGMELSGEWMHAAAKLQVEDTADSSEAYKALQEAAGGSRILWMKDVAITFEDGLDAPYDGGLKLRIKLDDGVEAANIKLLHYTETGEVIRHENESSEEGYFETTIETMSDFALINTAVTGDSTITDDSTVTGDDSKTDSGQKTQTSSTQNKAGVKTGDSSWIYIWLVLAAAALSICILFGYWYHKKRRK